MKIPLTPGFLALTLLLVSAALAQTSPAPAAPVPFSAPPAETKAAALLPVIAVSGNHFVNPAGQTVVFLDGGASSINDTTLGNSYKTAWFGASVPSGFTLGFYGGTGVGLGTGGDAVNLYNVPGTLQVLTGTRG